MQAETDSEGSALVLRCPVTTSNALHVNAGVLYSPDALGNPRSYCSINVNKSIEYILTPPWAVKQDNIPKIIVWLGRAGDRVAASRYLTRPTWCSRKTVSSRCRNCYSSEQAEFKVPSIAWRAALFLLLFSRSFVAFFFAMAFAFHVDVRFCYLDFSRYRWQHHRISVTSCCDVTRVYIVPLIMTSQDIITIWQPKTDLRQASSDTFVVPCGAFTCSDQKIIFGGWSGAPTYCSN